MDGSTRQSFTKTNSTSPPAACARTATGQDPPPKAGQFLGVFTTANKLPASATNTTPDDTAPPAVARAAHVP